MVEDGYRHSSKDCPGAEYEAVLNFARANQGLTYDRFDGAIVRSVNLFAIKEHFDFSKLEENLDYILGVLPVFKRILASPIIRLKDHEEILPVEAVRLVNNRTVVHASVHSELWESVGKEGMRPKKLMTIQQQDDYAIYENLVVARAVNTVLGYVSKNIRSLNDLLYTDRNMRFNLLDRGNHLSYFLAIGKLHIGYVRDYDRYRSRAESCLEKLLFIDRVLRARLNCPLYRRCGGYTGNLPLKKTNIFRNQKEYHRIYLLMKWLEMRQISYMEEASLKDLPSREAYHTFCGMMAIFSAGHFNFTFDENRPICFEALDQDAAFLGWKLHVGRVSAMEGPVILLTVEKDRRYRVALVPVPDCKNAGFLLKSVREQLYADEYHILSPVHQKQSVCVSLFDIESFRRLQQILLRAMIYADEGGRDCPFCGNSLTKNSSGGKTLYECAVCRMQIEERFCEKAQKSYRSTAIKGFVAEKSGAREWHSGDQYLKDRYTESLLHFRNITEIDQSGRALCPFCGIKHF